MEAIFLAKAVLEIDGHEELNKKEEMGIEAIDFNGY